ncbi:MAG: ABC transporter ATP-binding protein [Candidatus Edwardsbacteria bacterium]|nr:ABC transporter ATP-binding protein [Candidatus Edwardsbacteria bacterium]MBU1575589.1 ABC transporter ATP-binding protein [Candidatus Edwardsbacteria bacterium]MBU2463537.1 ABC transporter ATP-binding protein [Candidatus Edwardsbacteria bacterium]MBU2593854.1 ABC transporter ATP-binding protein [Candidatus Edwardsbacteria bacterium]
MENILEIDRLTKRFTDWEHFSPKSKTILDRISLEVKPGEIFGFLGPNGAGKTTTIKALMGIIRPSSGTARIMGHDILEKSQEVKKRIGFLPENPYFYDYLTVGEFIRFCAALFGITGKKAKAKTDELLELVGMTRAAGLPLRKCSKGMLQRTGIAQSLVNDPEFLVWDEPVSGLDPLGRKEVKDLMLELKKQGKTIFFSSHILPDAEALCDRVGIIVGGRMHRVGTLPELLKDSVSWVEVVAQNLPEGFALNDAKVEKVAGQLIIRLEGPDALDPALKKIMQAGGSIVSVSPQRENLESYFTRQVRTAKEAGQ